MCRPSIPLLEDQKPPKGSSLITFIGGPINGHKQIVPDGEMFIYVTSVPEPNVFHNMKAPKIINYKHEAYRRSWDNKNEFFHCPATR